MKVLYTFDDESKTNCLARWPQILDIRTAHLDENTQIGVIELKTCIHAVVSASPELVANLGHDYTVYAYDYSEYETPLVGQGMLSWVLASSSSTPSVPAHLSRAVVTGRVCKNILGLFTSNAQETLEVKLRLVPVPACLQSDFMETMKKYREWSMIMPEGFDAGAWTAFLQANPTIVQMATHNGCQGPGQQEQNGLECLQRLISEGSGQNYSVEHQPVIRANNHANVPPAEQLSRAVSPASSVQSAAACPKRRGRPPRTASLGRESQPRIFRSQEPASVSSTVGEDQTEEGPVKKRARVSKTSWTGTSSFVNQPDSLRVMASTAASVRIHQPAARRPLGNGNPLQDLPRAPTPIPNPTPYVGRPLLPAAKSSLRRESLSAENITYESPYIISDATLKPPDSAVTSPDDNHTSTLNTPQNIPSSPPLYRGMSTAPSSPNLPPLPRQEGSGFSYTFDDLFEDDEMRPVDEEDVDTAAQYEKRQNLPVTKEKLPPGLPADSTNAQEAESNEPAPVCAEQRADNVPALRALERTVSSGEIPLCLPQSDSTRPASLTRSQSWSGTQGQSLGPDVRSSSQPSEGLGVSKPQGKSRTGSGAKRKKAIQSKLATSVAAGQIPPFCENCGAIETPTWRKAWVKIHSGTPEHVRISEEEGGIVAWETLQTDVQGNIVLFRIIKKSLLPFDEGFTEILLCNRK